MGTIIIALCLKAQAIKNENYLNNCLEKMNNLIAEPCPQIVHQINKDMNTYCEIDHNMQISSIGFWQKSIGTTDITDPIFTYSSTC